MSKRFLVVDVESGNYESHFFDFLTDHELYTMADKYLVYDVINHKKLKHVSYVLFGTGETEYSVTWEEV